MRSLLLLSFLLIGSSVCYAQQENFPQHGEHNTPPEQADSTLTWEQLTDLIIEVETPAPLQTIFHIKFPKSLKQKDGKNVSIKGFMYPLEAGETHDYFLLSATPPSCPFCLPGGSMTLIEVNCAEPIEYTMEPILLQGKFTLLEDAPAGLYYQINEAHSASTN